MKKRILPLILLTMVFATTVVLATPPHQTSEGDVYVVQAGDWLSKIADKYLGDVLAYPQIVAATNAKATEDSSFATITNPDVIEIGQKLWIPAMVKTATEASLTTQTAAPVTEIAIRRLNEGQNLTQFAEVRDNFVALLKEQPGVGSDREFEVILDFSTFAPPEPPVFIGMTRYESLDAFKAAGEAFTQNPTTEGEAFIATFNPEFFTVLQPLNPDDDYDLTTMATAPGQVLEIAPRDLSTYEDFDLADYKAKRDAFLAELAKQDGFVAEYQWVSALDPNIVVGMTVYQDFEAFQVIATSDFAQSAVSTDFVGHYPAMLGYISVDARSSFAE